MLTWDLVHPELAWRTDLDRESVVPNNERGGCCTRPITIDGFNLRRLAELFDLGEDDAWVGVASRCVRLLESDHALFVDDYHRSEGSAELLVQNSEALADRTVRPVVSQQRVGYRAKRRCERHLCRTRVTANAQDLGACLLERIIVNAERGDLVRSTACEREDVERKYDVLVPSVIT